ncbi:phage tail protein [Mesorhizobium sp. B2-5-9]|uniref:phage tail-collar fiber domain-containing protein n=1 Tax=Mesorhizobium sp. B2-5-9 TaxID=2589921 RepID=UPI0015E45766|nr:phage tail protein [Mesorhizobium sp. B2-5-9]
MSFFAIPTLAGQAAIAAAVAGDAALDIATMAVGDGNGAAVTPVETQTNLVGQRAVVPVNSVVRDDDTPTRVTVDAILDQNTGGWIIREAGIYDSDGMLLFVASIPATEKQTLADGVDDVLTIGLIIVVSAAASIELTPSDGVWATPEYVATQLDLWRTHVAQPLRPYFMTVDGFATVDPTLPALGTTLIVGAGATGLFAGHDYDLAQYRGVAFGWSFAAAPIGHMVTMQVSGATVIYRRTGGAWRTVVATLAEHLAGTSTELLTNPAGVKAMINNKFPGNAPGVLANDGAGNLTWVALFDIKGLTAKTSVAGGDWFAVYDPVLDANRKVTAEMIAATVALSDYLHSEMFFLGSQ